MSAELILVPQFLLNRLVILLTQWTCASEPVPHYKVYN